jgi:hypothetical protein
MQQLLTHPKLQQVPHEAVVREGGIWDTLKKLAEEFHIDVIVVGTRTARVEESAHRGCRGRSSSLTSKAYFEYRAKLKASSSATQVTPSGDAEPS